MTRTSLATFSGRQEQLTVCSVPSENRQIGTIIDPPLPVVPSLAYSQQQTETREPEQPAIISASGLRQEHGRANSQLLTAYQNVLTPQRQKLLFPGGDPHGPFASNLSPSNQKRPQSGRPFVVGHYPLVGTSTRTPADQSRLTVRSGVLESGPPHSDDLCQNDGTQVFQDPFTLDTLRIKFGPVHF